MTFNFAIADLHLGTSFVCLLSSNKHTGWNKRVLRAEFFCYYMKKGFYYIEINEQGRRGTKTQKSISKAARLLDR